MSGRGYVNLAAPSDPRDYTPERGELVAERFAAGESLTALHQSAPELFPAPMYVRRWVRDVPSFAALMREAHAARAEYEAETAALESRDPAIGAPRARNAMMARQWMAERLDPDAFGQRRIVAGDRERPVGVQAVAMDMSDAELAAIAMEGRAAVPLRLAGPPVAGGGGEAAPGAKVPARAGGTGAPVSPTTPPDDSVNVSDDPLGE
jgi:hypothetical protein